METSNKILLARPHPFIEKPMLALLQSLGFEPQAAATLGPETAAPAGRYRGVVISTSVISKVRAGHREALEALRVGDPDLPVVFTTLAPLVAMAAKLEKELGKKGPMALYHRAKLPPYPQDLGGAQSYLLLHKQDLGDPSFQSMLHGMLHAHFRPRWTGADLTQAKDHAA